MRKIFVKMASMVLIFVMCLSSLIGCGLVTTDAERDMKQVVATVQIKDGAPEEVILKKDMVMAYLNYGYMYEQYYGYTKEQTFTLIIDSLVNNRIFVQSVIDSKYEETKGWEVANYLDDVQKVDANYNTYKAINDLLDGFKEQEEADKSDTVWDTVRTTPTNAANKEDELTKTDKEEYIAKGFDTDSSADARNAFNKVVELLRVNELLGDDYDGKDLTKTDYFKQTLKNYQETELITAFEKQLKDNKRVEFLKDKDGNISLEALNDAYKEKRQTQKDMTDSELVAKLSSSTASDPILVGLNDKYGYVYNLLIGADNVLTNEISNIKTEKDNKNITKLKYAEERAKILKATTVIDQRSSWISSGYDFDLATNTFTGDYTFAEKEENRLPFYGDVFEYPNADEDTAVKYRVDGVEELSLDKFVLEMEKYLYKASSSLTNTTTYITNLSAETTASIYKKVVWNTQVEEYENKINELLFAFSTDPGSLNTYKGYVIKPVPEGADSEEYMQEFADAARELIATPNNKYGYIMVATDYGYHVMFYSEVLEANYGYENLTDYLDVQYGAQDWTKKLNDMLADWDEVEDTENYLYLLANSLFSTEVNNTVTNYQREMLNTYRYAEDGGVTIYESRYADLLA